MRNPRSLEVTSDPRPISYDRIASIASHNLKKKMKKKVSRATSAQTSGIKRLGVTPNVRQKKDTQVASLNSVIRLTPRDGGGKGSLAL